MVLQAERYNGGYQQQSYSAYQGPTVGYNRYQSVTDYTSPPYSSPFQGPTYSSSYGQHHQSGWSSGGGGDYYGNGGSHFSGGVPHLVKPSTGGYGIHPVKPTTGGYGNSYYENSHAHENSYNHGSPRHQGYGSPHHQSYGSPHHQGHGSPHHQGYGSPHHQGHDSGHGYDHGHESSHHQGHDSTHGYGKTHGFGSGITNKINKLTHGPNSYGTGSPGYGPNYSGYNNGQQQQPSWILKGLDDD